MPAATDVRMLASPVCGLIARFQLPGGVLAAAGLNLLAEPGGLVKPLGQQRPGRDGRRLPQRPGRGGHDPGRYR
jgi:hypothetical protein